MSTLDILEKSLDRGEPISLYKFTYGPGVDDYFAYTDAEDGFVLEGTRYRPTMIRRAEIRSSGTMDRTKMEIEVLNTDPIAEMFRVFPPSYSVGVQVWSSHVETLEAGLSFSGRVLSCSRDGAQMATLSCEPSTISMQRVGLRRAYQYMCPHVLYGTECRANKVAATIMVVPESTTGRQVLISSVISNRPHYAGGILEWVNEDGMTEYRTVQTITEVAGGKSSLVLTGIARGMSADRPMKLSKGCAHNTQACMSVHNNILNYGGQPYIPTKNPLGRTTPFL